MSFYPGLNPRLICKTQLFWWSAGACRVRGRQKSTRRSTPAGIGLASAEKVLGARASQCCCAWAILRRDELVQASDNRGWDTAVLAADEIRCCCGLVGDRDQGGFKLLALSVYPPPPVV
jgi:hypothetical protein